MSTRTARQKIFEDTFAWCRTSPALISSIAQAKAGTKVYKENEYPEYDRGPRFETELAVSKKRSFQAAADLHRADDKLHIAVLNFANAFRPGGGVTQGAGAQEECLCRCSTLYPLLCQEALRPDYYGYHIELNDPRATDRLIYTPGVVICKTDTDLPERMDEEEWVETAVITCAAPDLWTMSNLYARIYGLSAAGMSDDELYDIHVSRARHILTVAAAEGNDALVLGAFGCGAFLNDPDIVAKAYKSVLQEFAGVFRKIEFAVYCPPEDDTNYQVFQKAFPEKTLGTQPEKQADDGTEKRKAVKSDWETEDMPARHVKFDFVRRFTEEELRKLSYGNIPKEMEDKWFWYMEGDTLYAHRSWTGYCIFILEIRRGSDVHRATVNRKKEQYSGKDIQEDREMIGSLLDLWT